MYIGTEHWLNTWLLLLNKKTNLSLVILVYLVYYIMRVMVVYWQAVPETSKIETGRSRRAAQFEV